MTRDRRNDADRRSVTKHSHVVFSREKMAREAQEAPEYRHASLTAFLMGDPPVGRSALDRRGMPETAAPQVTIPQQYGYFVARLNGKRLAKK